MAEDRISQASAAYGSGSGADENTFFAPKHDESNLVYSLSSLGTADSEDPERILQEAIKAYHPRIAIASSFSKEDVVLIDMAVKIAPDIKVFALDTGRLPEETYECAETVRERYGLTIEWYFPEREAVEALIRAEGTHSFRRSLEARRECCRIRKVEPLGRALSGLEAWITGMRRGHGVTRGALAPLERDALHGGIAKYNPLAAWTDGQVEAYVRQRALPVNRLHAQGYASIGCAPCTRAIAPGEDPRAGRWWWESPEHKECGLHGRGK